MRLKPFSCSLMAIALMGLAACTASAESSNKQLAAIKAKITKQLPGKEVTSVKNTPVQGIYEVVLANSMIVYTDTKADYVITGEMINLAAHKNLTADRLEEIHRIDPTTLPLDSAIKEVRGDGSRKLYVFTDPDCPFCKKLEQDSLKNISNITIYNFMMPLPQLHPDAQRKARVIWCAPNRSEAWHNWIIDGKLPEGVKDDCDNPVEKTMQLGTKLGINGTPALIFASGRMVPGAIPAADIEKLLGTEKK